MPFVQAAISVSDAIETYGAYAGLAAVVGLGVLSLLYFAQAREVKRLREWAAGAEEREADLTRRIVAQASRAAAASRPLSPQTAAGKGQKPVPKAAPATVAAAAAVAKVADPPTGPHAVPAAAGATAAATATPPAAADGPTTVTPAIPAKPAAAPPAGAPGAPNGQPPMAKPAEIPAKPAAAAPAAQDTGDTGPVQPVRTTAPRPARAATPVAAPPSRGPARRGEDAGGRSTGKVLGIVAGVVLGVVVVGFGATQLLGGDDAPAPSNTVGETVAEPAAGSGSASEEPARTSTTAAGGNAPSSVNVAVLNGTTVTGLAAEIAQQIEKAGYVRGTVTNSPDQSRSATIVSFREGSRSDALKVAQQIGVGEDAVQPLDPSDAVTAGEDADVVVIVGADRTDLP
ncbi:LytR C-terminal domain-containing protein [Svornostia abyssi]|uniref:LytR C-terminal domain-containing protein n=1 Tax=Svornostia abyssi TaxID=2898438 RepID=A0ABY5PK57_9ACTN|nr:LytR C-terminal domain-containing protein [Parviterribacteraceae bacterium J379]